MLMQSQAPKVTHIQIVLYHAQKQNLRSPVPGFEARREHVATGRDMCDMIPASQLGGGIVVLHY